MGGANPIPDAYMTANSEERPAYNGRLHGSSAWRMTTADQTLPVPTFYIQVSLDI